jgi:hypothetical protein
MRGPPSLHARHAIVGLMAASLLAACTDSVAPAGTPYVWTRTFDDFPLLHPDGLDLIGSGADGGISAVRASDGSLAWRAQFFRRGPVQLWWLGEQYAARDSTLGGRFVYGDARTGAVTATAAPLFTGQEPIARAQAWMLVRAGDTLLAGLSVSGDSVLWQSRPPLPSVGSRSDIRYRTVGAIGNDVVVEAGTVAVQERAQLPRLLRIGPTGAITPLPQGVSAEGIVSGPGVLWNRTADGLEGFDASSGSRIWHKSADELIGRPGGVSLFPVVSAAPDGQRLRVAYIVFDSTFVNEDFVAVLVNGADGAVLRREQVRRPVIRAPDDVLIDSHFGHCGTDGTVRLFFDGRRRFFNWSTFRFTERQGPGLQSDLFDLQAAGPTTLLALRSTESGQALVSAVRCAP